MSTSSGSPAAAIVAPVVRSGSHVLRIDGNSTTKGLGNGNYIESETFAAGGRLWCLHYYPDSFSHRNSSDSICIVVNLVHADVDEMEAKFMISLLDQSGNPVPSYIHISSPQTYDTTGKCCLVGFDIIESRILETSAYLKDNPFSDRCDVTVVKKVFTKAIQVSEVLGGVVKDEGLS